MGGNVGSGDEDDDIWWRPTWQTEDETDLPGTPRSRQPARDPDYAHPLLAPLARAQEAITRLEARVQAAAPAIAEGLRARMAYREAAGWLAYAHVWIHPRDLALRDAGLTGSYGPAARAGHLEAELPATTGHGSEFEIPPSDLSVDRALRLARLWRRLAEVRTWSPIADATTTRETLQQLGCGASARDIDDWHTVLEQLEAEPALIRAGRAARDWMNRAEVKTPLTQDGIFLAACVWRQGGSGRAITLPFWTVPELRLQRLAPRVGLEWMAGFLDIVADAAKAGLVELGRLQTAAGKGRHLTATVRSKLPSACEAVLRAPVITARGLAHALDVTPQAALGLLRQLTEAEIIREATGRASWRAFVLA